MADLDRLDAFLRTDPGDVGCDEALRVLAAYVDLVVTLSAEEAQHRYPGVAAHLSACGPCGADFEGLLVAARTWGATEPEDPS